MGNQSKYTYLLRSLDVNALMEVYRAALSEWYADTYSSVHADPAKLDDIGHADDLARVATLALCSETIAGDIMRDIVPIVWEACDTTPIELVVNGLSG